MPSVQTSQQQQTQQQPLQHTSNKDSKTGSNNQLNANTGGNKTPSEQPEFIKQVQIIIEKKVRNLEKRRQKLEEYQEIQKKGQVLNEDQLLAVSKYGEVKTSLELAKELDKQFITLANDTMKALKKQAKKEQIEREENLKEKLKQVQKIQALLNTLNNANIRSDFLEGKNGASQMTQQELDLICEFQKLTCLTQFNKTVENDVTESVDHILNLVENKNKPVLNTSYHDLNKLIERIMTSSYWTYEPDQQQPQQEEQQEEQQQQQQQQQQIQDQQPTQVENKETEQKNNNYQQNTSSDEYVFVTSQEVENTPSEQQQQQQQHTQQQQQSQQTQQQYEERTFFSTLNTPNNLNQFFTENNDGINFLQDSEITSQHERYDTQDQQQQQQQHEQVSQEYQQQQHQQGGGEFTHVGGNHGGNQYGFGKQRHYNNDNQNYRSNGNGIRRPYNQSDNNDRRGGGRGGYSGRGGPQGGRGAPRGNYRGGKPRGGPPSGNNFRNNNQPEGRNEHS